MAFEGSLEFSIPFNGNPDSLAQVFSLNKPGGNRVREVYLSGPQEFSASARIMPRMDLAGLANVVQRIHAADMRVNLLFNAVCEGSDWYTPEVMNSKLAYIGLMHEKHGVEAVTVANPLYIKEIRRRFPRLEICASVLSIIDSVQRAVYFRELGVDVIVPDKCLNRDLETLRQIKEATGAELKLIVNAGCLYKCPFERFHAAFISHKSLEEYDRDNTFNFQKVFFGNCSEMANRNREYIFQSPWIRPENARQYGDITHFFKISGRSNPQWFSICEAYMEEKWKGNLLELMDASLRFLSEKHGCGIDNRALDGEAFFNMVTTCNHECRNCSYCRELAGKLITEATAAAG